MNKVVFVSWNRNFSFLSDPLVEIEDKMFDCLMEFAKADVNSPRSIRALSQASIEVLSIIFKVFWQQPALTVCFVDEYNADSCRSVLMWLPPMTTSVLN